MKKRIMSAVLAVVMLVSLLPCVGVTAEIFSGDGWSFDSSTGTLTVSTNEGTSAWRNTVPYTTVDTGKGNIRTYQTVRTLIISNNVTSTEWGAFAGCTNLTSVIIPNSVTQIGSNAFSHCWNLTSVIIPNSVTQIGSYAFADCGSLTTIIIPNSVISIEGGAFWDCPSLTDIIIPSSVTVITEGMGLGFFEVRSETDWHTVKVENLTIRGVVGSAAQSYANEHGFNFIAIDEQGKMCTFCGDTNCFCIAPLCAPCRVKIVKWGHKHELCADCTNAFGEYRALTYFSRVHAHHGYIDRTITFRFFQSLGGQQLPLPNANQLALMRQGAANWNNSGANVKFVENETSHNKIFVLGNVDNNYYGMFYGRSAANTWLSTRFDIEMYNGNIARKARNYDNFFTSVFVHELGHVIGLKDNPRGVFASNSIMNYSCNLNNITTPRQFDIDNVNALYPLKIGKLPGKSTPENANINTTFAAACYPYYESITDLTDEATDVVRAEVLDSRVERLNTLLDTPPEDYDPYKLYTVYRIKILETFQGNANAGDIIEIRQLGGETEDEILVNMDGVDIEVGEELVLFLRESYIEGYPSILLSPIQSVYRVAEDGTIESTHPEHNELVVTPEVLEQIQNGTAGCGDCNICKSGEPPRLGYVLGNATVTTVDALEILKYIVKLPGAISGCNNARKAALIVGDTVTTADALEILKHIVKLPNKIDGTA